MLSDYCMRLALFVIIFALLLVGCATKHRSLQSTPLSFEQYRQMYPRHYLYSLNPWERRQAEYLLNREHNSLCNSPGEAWP